MSVEPDRRRPCFGEITQQKILVIGDNPGPVAELCNVAGTYGFFSISATRIDRFEADLARGLIDIVVLDIEQPREASFELCQQIRSIANTPIIILTSLVSEIDRVLALETGADDYITKPVGMRELIARLRALARRVQWDRMELRGAGPTKHYEFCGWSIIPAQRKLFSPEGLPVTLTTAEFDLLSAFCQRPGIVLSRDQLLELTHSGSAGPMDRSVDVHVSRVRQKLEREGADSEFIKTVRLGGYIFTPPVRSFA